MLVTGQHSANGATCLDTGVIQFGVQVTSGSGTLLTLDTTCCNLAVKMLS